MALRLANNEFTQGKLQFPDLQQEARVLLKYGAEYEGYWNSEKFLIQTLAAIKIVRSNFLLRNTMHNGFLIIVLATLLFLIMR